MNFPYITYVTSPNSEFPLRKGDQLRIKNPDGTRDVVTLVRDVSRPSKSRQSPEFSAVTSRQWPDGNKRQIGTPWTF